MSLTSRFTNTVEVFFSYSHKDQRLRDELETRLSLLKREGLISSWYDRKIGAGEEWAGKIDEHLNTAQLILLLISPDFIASDYCYDLEMKRALERHKAGEARVIPVILRPTEGWEKTDFGKLMALPRNSKPITRWSDRDEAFSDVAKGIREAVEALTAKSQVAPKLPVTYRGIIGIPPPTDPKTIQQRDSIAKDIYSKLIQPDVTAIVLTGIDGLGKSILAALVYHYAEEQRLAHTGPFTSEALWLKIDPSVTMADLAGTMFDILGKPMPDLSQMAPQNQAQRLFKALDTSDQPRLIVLDQFEKLLDGRTGQALPDRLGIAEWLDALNSQKCRCRVLLTSQILPRGESDYPSTYLQEYPVKPLAAVEGIELLRNLGVTATEAELREAVTRCGGHALALTLLASLVRRHSGLRLLDLLEDTTYAQLWIGDIARNLLDRIYTQQLNQVERKLLLGFSVYREAVPLEAAQAILDFGTEMPKTQIPSALDILLSQHLLIANERGRYQPQAIVARYAQNHFDEANEQLNLRALQAARTRAAQYYVQQAATSCPPQAMRRGINDVHPFIEAVWQLCQATLWQEAYTLMEKESLFSDLQRWGGNAVLLELCLQLLPLEKWQPQRAQAAHIYDNLGRIYNALGKRMEALKYYEQALDIFQEVGDSGKVGLVLSNIGRVYSALGRKMVALKYYEQALDILSKAGDRDGEGTTLSHIGRVYSALGQQEQAKNYYEQALNILKEVGDQSREGLTLSYLARVYSILGQREQALNFCEQALSILKSIGDRRGEDRALDNRGRVYISLKQYEQAQRSFEQALNLAREVGDRNGEGMMLQGLGEVYRSLGQVQQAQEYYEQALNLLREVGDRWREGITLTALGEVYADLGRKDQAWQYFKDALYVHREVEDRRGEATTLYNLGTLYFERRRYDVALACFLLAESIFGEVQNPQPDVTQKWIDDVRSKVDEEQFSGLLAEIEAQGPQIIEQALQDR